MPDNNNNKVLLREQGFQVLRMLVAREGKIVPRKEIKSRLWVNDTVDFDHSINAMIKAVRRALKGFSGRPSVHRDLGTAWLSIDAVIEYLESGPGTTLQKDREQQSAAEMSENAAGVQRPMKPHWWKAAAVLASVVILLSAS